MVKTLITVSWIAGLGFSSLSASGADHPEERLECPPGSQQKRKEKGNKLILHYCADPFGKKQGPFRAVYMKTGILAEEGKFLEDTLDGNYRAFFPNGRLAIEGQVASGTPIEHWKSYYFHGQLKDEGAWSQGKPNGMWSFYYPNGNLKTQGEYVEGRKNGAWQTQLINSEMENAGTYSYGRKICKWTYRNAKTGMLEVKEETKTEDCP